MALASAFYSYSVLERDTVACFGALHEIKLGPKKMAKPPVERLSSRQPSQSASEKALIKESGVRLLKSDTNINRTFHVSQNPFGCCPMSCGGSMKELTNFVNRE